MMATHNHSEYSNIRLLDSINTVRKMVEYAQKIGLKGIAITDHEVLSAHVEAVQLQKEILKENPESDFKILLGNEVYLIDDVEWMKENYEGGVTKFHHFVLIAKDEIGHKQLRELSSQAWLNSFRTRNMERVPIDKMQLQDIIGKNKGHLVASTACLGGELPQLYLEGVSARKERDFDKIERINKRVKRFVAWGVKQFGEGNFFIEIQPGDNDEQIGFNEWAVQVANEEGVDYIVSTDSHYLNKEARPIHKAYLNAKEGDREIDDFYSTTYLMDVEETDEYLQKSLTPHESFTAMQNTMKIHEMCEFYDLHKDIKIPEIELPEYVFSDVGRRVADIEPCVGEYEFIHKFAHEGTEQDRYFLYEVLKGLLEKNKVLPEYLERINLELGEIWGISKEINERVSAYYVTAQKIIQIMWAEGDSLVGPARGSVTGYLTAYLTDITQVDPIEWNLPHWRHLTATRPEMPDVDIDSQQTRRIQILQAMRDYFNNEGKFAQRHDVERVLNIATFGTEGSKSACLTSCRGHDIDVDIAQYLAGMIPVERGSNWSLHDCFYGNEEKGRKKIDRFINEVALHKGLKETMLGIEGLINKRSVHASGVYIYNDHYTEYNACMRAPSGQLTTQWNMDHSDYMGGLKFDFLTIQALDKIRITMDLMIEESEMIDQGTLKKTYDKYLHPDVLEYEDQDMWKQVALNTIVDLFQFDTQVGLQAAKKIAATSLTQLMQGNSLMRLMSAGHGQEQPIDKYVRFKNNIELWYSEMRGKYYLNEHEIKALEKHLLELFGVADTQEVVMEMSMDPKIGGFDLIMANKLRKAIAKKKASLVDPLKEKFYETGMALGNRKNILDYVWKECIVPQLGYSFSKNHTNPYSMIALQELNLATLYPSVYWNTACLTVNSGSADEDAEKQKSTDYGKIAASIGAMKTRGVKVSLPHINDSCFGFKPNGATNTILYGLKGINGIGDDITKMVVANRPYKSISHFLDKVSNDKLFKINKTQIANLIKAGCFDEIEGTTREESLRKYVDLIADKKKRITMQNFNMMIGFKMIPQEYDWQRRVFNFNKYIKKDKFIHTNNEIYYYLDDKAQPFFMKNFDQDLTRILNGRIAVKKTRWHTVYTKHMEPAKMWIKENKTELLDKLNQHLVDEMWDKYGKGTISSWEMDSISFYYHDHELAEVEYDNYSISDFHALPETPDVVGNSKFNGRTYPIYDLTRIIGTVIDKDKYRHTVTLLTNTGVCHVKFYGAQFSVYDKQVSVALDNGKKKVVEKGWFSKGNKLMITGFRRDDQFIPKKYKNTGGHTVYIIDKLEDDNTMKLRYERKAG